MLRWLICIFFLSSGTVYAQHLNQLSFGGDSTLEVMSWNLEFFPKNDQSTIDSVRTIIEALDVDVIGVQEINDQNAFNELVNGMQAYDGYLVNSGNLRLGYIYKTATVDFQDAYTIFPDNSREFPRRPLVLEFAFNKENFVVINNHLKCCGDGELDLSDDWDEEKRRFDASNLLDQIIQTDYPDEHVIVLGDLNDILTDVPGHNVFGFFINDPANYLFPDIEIAEGVIANWSFPNWPSHIDHLLITSELFDAFHHPQGDVQTIKIDEFLAGGFSAYDQNISDHRPVAVKLLIPDNSVGFREENFQASNLSVFPNPSRGTLNLVANLEEEAQKIEMRNLDGQLVYAAALTNNQISLDWKTLNIAPGFYSIAVLAENSVLAVAKAVLIP